MSDDEHRTRALPDGPPGELPLGAELNGGQYKIVRNINAGGFGITYQAQDNLGRDVAIKECFPLGLVARTSGRSVSAASENTAASFSTARNLFLREARLLAQLSHPNVVHVQTMFEENGTAYMAMDFIHGQDLEQIIKEEADTINPAWVDKLANTVLNALAYLHESGLLHRDISPSNIRIDQFDRPILIDFGAARQQVRTETRKMGSFRVVKDGYSPGEFYIPGTEQAAPSDLYSLAATLYHLIAGKAPTSADIRQQKVATSEPDPYEPLVGRFPGHNSALLSLIDQSMSLNMRERPQSAQEWIDKLALHKAPPTPPPPPPEPKTPPPPPPPTNQGFAKGAVLGALGAGLLAGAAFLFVPSGGMSSEDAQALQRQLDDANGRIETLVASQRDSQSQITRLEDDLADARDLIALRTQERDDARATPGGGTSTTPVGCPNFEERASQSASLTGDFLLNSRPTYRVDAGNGSSVIGCPNIPGRGFFTTQPSLSLSLSSLPSNLDRVEFVVTAPCDTTMLINTPNTMWYFDDDANGRLQPRLIIPSTNVFNAGDGGRLDLWVGTFSEDDSCEANVELRGF